MGAASLRSQNCPELVYGQTRAEAIARVQALALRVLADRLEHGETVPELGEVFAVVA